MKIIMISICSYCNKITKAKVVIVNSATEEEIERGFQISHGICEECYAYVIKQVREGEYV